ncbi:hypothetical protein TURU_081865 [Turdus rufiventris]|nr:hypothetical protein TURU_081865 [Turdus rufiventris]
MLWNLANLGPSQYTTIVMINADDNRETVSSVAKKLRNFDSLTNDLMQAHVSAMVKDLQEEVREMRGMKEATCILSIDFLRNGYYKDPKGFRWTFGIAAVAAEGIKQLKTLPELSESPSAMRLLKVTEQQVPIATLTVHCQQYRTNRDDMIPIHKMIHELESQGEASKTHSPFNSPIWPVCKSNGDWRLTVDYHALNEVTPPLSAAMPHMQELQYELESKAARWYATIDIANAFFSIPLAAECRPQFAFTWKGHAVHLESSAPGVETQPHHLPWTDPNCTGKG